MIRKEGSRYAVYDATGRKRLGTHATKADAARQLRAIEAAKHSRGKRR